jgi:outer membrane PBP1 activator LpoA protein
MRIRISLLASTCLLALSLSAAAEDVSPIRVNTALLLPLSGPLASSAEAIRDGFIAANQRAGGKATIKVYDVGSGSDSTLAAYRLAFDEGAALVIGPLRKESVAALAANGAHKAPILALNYLDENAAVPSDFYQFGLSPEDEARSAAERAVADSDKRALAMVPNTEWGARVLAAFDKRLHELGGGVIQTMRYTPGKVDFTQPIKELMKLDVSEARHKALTGIIGTKTEFEPRRRDDVDFVFMAARAADARLLWPQLRFMRTTDLPVYATSLVYEGHADSDLEGVRFCDMPWMIQSGSYANEHTRAAESASIRTQPRLFALGRDAYLLAGLIESGQLKTGTSYPAATGNLQLTGKSIISRGLTCARFTSDGIEPLAAGLNAE